MLAARITPKTVTFCFAVCFGLWLISDRAEQFGQTSHQALRWQGKMISGTIVAAAALLAYALACRLCMVIAAEHRHARRMQIAWWLLAANAGLSVIRSVVESPWVGLLLPDWSVRGLLIQIIVFPANACLLVGCIAMWLALRSVGLPARLKPIDWFLIGLVILLSVMQVIFRGGFSEADSPYLLARYAQPFGIPIFAGYSVLGAVLYRMAVEMGGGRLSLAIRCLVFYMLLRAINLVVSNGYESLNEQYDLNEFRGFVESFNEIIWQIVRWLPALAAAFRLQMSTQASRELQRLRQSKSVTPPETVPDQISGGVKVS
jgi:hypothetical protein